MDSFYIDHKGRPRPIPDCDDAPISEGTLWPLIACAVGAWALLGAGVLVGLLLAY